MLGEQWALGYANVVIIPGKFWLVILEKYRIGHSYSDVCADW